MSRRPGGSVHADLSRHRLAARLGSAVAGLPEPPATPLLVVDLDAFEANAADLVRRAGGKPVRVATKSLRVPALIQRVLAMPGFRGVLAYTLREALWLAREGGCDDVLMGYPTVDRAALARLLADEALAARITLMVDGVEHLDLVASLHGSGSPPVRVALDVDASLRLPGVVVGPRRSPLVEPPAVAALAARVVEDPRFELVGVMTYEGQVAGVPDRAPGRPARSAAVRAVKAASVRQLARRRAAVAEALAPLAQLRLWNAGGSGSLETSAADRVVTEVTAGSGLLVPHLFDHYRSFRPRPAAFFAVPVVRRPAPDVVTVAGGGLAASGTSGPDRAPLPYAPAGLRLTALEGAGEVQTPLVGSGAGLLEVGDLVWFRHAKAGEPAEHSDRVHLVRGHEVVDTVPTYRGLGRSW